MPGATAIFKLIVKDKEGQRLNPVQLSYIFYSMKKGAAFEDSPIFLEWKRLRNLEYTGGTIYFSGTSFSNVVAFTPNNKNSDNLKKYFDRCTIGSVITFENTAYKDDNGSVSRLNETFKL